MARDDAAAYDNELPPQAVELSSFRIARRPVCNAEFLAFMQAGGYREKCYWDDDGWDWRLKQDAQHPDHWRRNAEGHWYGIGINGPADLPANEPVTGINRFEAQAYANWVASLGGDFAGAVLPHEYQWELAARSGLFEQLGRGWEWCSNPFHPYPEFHPFPSEAVSAACFDQGQGCLRGGSVHTQKMLRRPSYRRHALPHQRFLFAGIRLVFPPIG